MGRKIRLFGNFPFTPKRIGVYWHEQYRRSVTKTCALSRPVDPLNFFLANNDFVCYNGVNSPIVYCEVIDGFFKENCIILHHL